MDKLFNPNLEELQQYGEKLSKLFYKLGFCTKKDVEKETDTPILIGKIPYVFRVLGIPSGKIELLPNNIPHMIGFGQEKTTASYRNMHDLNIEEMLSIPYMLSDPDMIFRSNTRPNSSIIACKEVAGRNNPIVIAMKVDIKSVLDGGAIVVSGYEKDNSPKEFFTRLYDNGFCIYDGKNKGYFEDIKVGTGVRDHHLGPIPKRAVTCTVPGDKSLSPEGIPPPDNQSILTKTVIVNKYRENTKEFIFVHQKSEERQKAVERNLNELGYHTVSPYAFSKDEVVSILKKCTGIACDRSDIPRFEKIREVNPNIKKIGEAQEFMPKEVFEHKLQPLAEILNRQKTESYIR